MGPTTSQLFIPFHTTFTPFSHYFYSTISLLFIKNWRVPPLHPLFLLFSTTLYIFLNLRAQTKRKELAGTEGVTHKMLISQNYPKRRFKLTAYHISHINHVKSQDKLANINFTIYVKYKPKKKLKTKTEDLFQFTIQNLYNYIVQLNSFSVFS